MQTSVMFPFLPSFCPPSTRVEAKLRALQSVNEDGAGHVPWLKVHLSVGP